MAMWRSGYSQIHRTCVIVKFETSPSAFSISIAFCLPYVGRNFDDGPNIQTFGNFGPCAPGGGGDGGGGAVRLPWANAAQPFPAWIAHGRLSLTAAPARSAAQPAAQVYGAAI